MKATNPVESLAEAVYAALNNNKYLPDIEYNSFLSVQDKKDGKEPIKKYRRPSTYDIKAYHFPQMWGSTALGFGGMGGAAMTEAYTTVIIYHDIAAVFFDGRHAYTLKVTEALINDVKNGHMESVAKKQKYEAVAAV